MVSLKKILTFAALSDMTDKDEQAPSAHSVSQV
jgi:hypothetical protein